MKTLKEQIAVMQARLEGKAIREAHYKDKISLPMSEHSRFNWAYYDYEIAVRNDYIDVEDVHRYMNYMATDGNGATRLHQHQPRWDGEVWRSDNGEPTIDARYFASFKRGTTTPENSLVDLYALRCDRGLL